MSASVRTDLLLHLTAVGAVEVCLSLAASRPQATFVFGRSLGFVQKVAAFVRAVLKNWRWQLLQ